MSLISESDCTEIDVNGIPVLAMCGPVTRGADGYDGGVELSCKIIADEGNLPVVIGQSVEIDGVLWEVAKSVVVFEAISVTFTRFSG